MANSPIELLKNRMTGAVMNAVADVATSAVSEGTELVKNGLKSKLNNIISSKTETTIIENPSDDSDDYEDVEVDNEYCPIPIAFRAFDPEKNLECAVAVWKLWGIRDTEADDDLDPDIIAVFKDGTAFVGTMMDFQDFCEHNDLDPEVDVYGLGEDDDYDSSEIDGMKVGKSTIKFVSSYLNSIDLNEAEDSFRGFHWDKNATVTKVVESIPFMENTPLTMCGVAQAIIYTAKKNGEVQTYIHEFGEDSGVKPTMYALPTPDGEKWPRSILIHGGNMRVEDKGIVD